MKSKDIGKIGEDIALEYLKEKGYIFLDKNFSGKYGEIDLIFKDIDFLVFVEVKLRKNTKFGYPRDFVTISKQKKIIATSEEYMELNNLYDFQPRFDIIEIVAEQKEIEHLINAFP